LWLSCNGICVFAIIGSNAVFPGLNMLDYPCHLNEGTEA